MSTDDLISRQAAIDAAARIVGGHAGYKACAIIEMLKNAPSAQPEVDEYEWCHDCKEYDQERHCCPRWNWVIRETLKDMQSERKKGKWRRNNTYRGDDTSGFVDPDWRCSECGKQASVNEWFMYDLTDFCPSCGADMRGDQDGDA